MSGAETTRRGLTADPTAVLQLDGGRPFLWTSDEQLESRDPADGSLVARTATSRVADVEAAVAAALAVARAGAWADDARRRARVLTRFASALREAAEPLATLLTREQGKTLREARAEVAGSADEVDYYAGLARAVAGRSVLLGAAEQGVVLHQPIGVVGVITPWNAPLRLMVRALAPALAAGNAVLVKPASLTPAITVEALALLAADPELPAGAIGCVIGSGGTVGRALVTHPDVGALSFTGDTSTGVEVLRDAAPTLKRVGLELGGKSPNVVFADADLERAIPGACAAIFSGTGQICTAGSRLLVEDAVYDEVLARVAERAAALRVGPGLDPASDVGPLVSAAQRREVLAYVEQGRAEGRLVAGGEALGEGPLARGHFVAPTVLADLPAGSALLREEIFGPVLCVQRFADEAEALALANDTEYGLAAGLWTRDLERAWRVGRALEAGTVWINTYHRFVTETESAGVKRSGIGTVRGLAGLHEFTQTKHLNFYAEAP